MAILLLGLAAFSCLSLATYVGLAAFLAMDQRATGRGFFVFTAFVILIPLVCFVYDANFYHWLDNFTVRNVGPGRGFFAAYFALNAAFFAGIVLSYFSSRHLPAEFYTIARRACAYAAIPAVFWVVTNSRALFWPLTQVPDADALATRVIFACCFLLVSFGAYCLLAAREEA